MTKKRTKKRTKPIVNALSTKQIAQKPTVSISSSTDNRLQEAIEVKDLVMRALKDAEPDEVPKLIDSFARSSAEIRQLEKARRKELASFTDDEIVEHVRSLPDRRREALLVAVQGTSLAGKPLF